MKVKNYFRWLSLFFRTLIANRPKIDKSQPVDIIFCFVDHFEPRVGNVPLAKESERVEAWIKGYPELADKHVDVDGKPPQHTWFFPLDQFWAEHLDKLMKLVYAGYGEIEVHLHHRDDTPERLAQKLELAKKLFVQHGTLSVRRTDAFLVKNRFAPRACERISGHGKGKSGLTPCSMGGDVTAHKVALLRNKCNYQEDNYPTKFKDKTQSGSGVNKQYNARPTTRKRKALSPSPFVKYAFIHGNWALDNSREDGDWCGVNNELQVLRQTGCYADFTFPSGLSETQPRKVNKIYYATDDDKKPKSYNNGVDVEVGKPPSGDLMLITGPVGLNWKRRKWRIFPTLENSDISWHHVPTEERISLWLKSHIHVRGQPNWIFIKVHTHGAADKNLEMLLDQNGVMHRIFCHLEEQYNDGKKYRLHYVTAREMYNIIRATEAGMRGNPNVYRDYELIPLSAFRIEKWKI